MKKEEMIEKQMRIDIKNILPSLAQSLYGNDWRISIRELLQNCNDANIEARIADNNLQPSALPIRIISDMDQGTLTIQDEGIGMTLQEVTDYLATVGFGKKRERLEEISYDRESVDYNLIKDIVGKYGIGFLASFIIAEKIEVITRSRVVSEPAQKCLFSGETKWYHIEHGEDMRPGTIIILHLKQKYKDPKGEIDLLNPTTLEEVVSNFGDLIPYPIYRCEMLNEIGTLLNIREAPWENDYPVQGALEDFFSRRFPNSNLPLVVESFAFNKDKHNVEAKGLIYFPTGESAVNNQLFVKRMLIKEEFAELLPEWASFVGVILDCPELTPTLDRNNVVTYEPAFANLKISLTNFITEKIVEYATTRIDTFKKLLQSHLLSLQIALLKDWHMSKDGKEYFFRGMINYMPFMIISQDIPPGYRMSLDAYRKRFSLKLISQNISQKNGSGEDVHSVAKDPIYYLHEPIARVQYETLVIKKNIPVISAHFDREHALLKAYKQAFDDEVDVRDVKTVLEDIMGELPDQAPWECLINFYTEMRGGPQIVKVTSFEPNFMPGYLAVSEIDKEQVAKIEHYLSSGEDILTPRLKRQMDEELRRMRTVESELALEFIFYINAKNRLMDSIRRTIIEEGRLSELAVNVLVEIYHNAMLYANVAFGDARYIFEHRTSLLDNMLTDGKELKMIQSERDKMLIELKQFQNQECIDVSSIPVDPEPRYCVTLICDLTKSTWVLANIDSKDQGNIFNRYILEMKSVVEKHNGFFDKFTGDGLLAFFGLKNTGEVNDAAKRKICMDAKLCASEIAGMTDKLFGQEDVRNVLQKKGGIHAPQSCISLAAGEVAFGRFGGTGTAVGIPIVQAARIEAHRDFFENSRIICTEQFLTDSGVGIGEVRKLLLEEGFIIEGANPIDVYKLL